MRRINIKEVAVWLFFAFMGWWLFFGIHILPPDVVESIRIWCGWIFVIGLGLITALAIWAMEDL